MAEIPNQHPHVFSFEQYDFAGEDWIVQLQLGEQETRTLDDPEKRQQFLDSLREQCPLSERFVSVYLSGNDTFEARSFVSTGVVLRQREAALASGLNTVFSTFVDVYKRSMHVEEARVLPARELGSTDVEDAWFALPRLIDGELDSAKQLVAQEREHGRAVTQS